MKFFKVLTFLSFEFFILSHGQSTTVPIQFKTGLIKFLKRKGFFNLIEAETSTVPSITYSTTTSTTVSTTFSTSLPSMTSANADMDLQRGLKRRKRPLCGKIPIYDRRCHGEPIHPPDSKNFPPKNPGAIQNIFKCGSIRQIFNF